MAKKSEKAEPKKECPSCGLGVAPESSICEFCGWDFEEEDEWILQIEKLERDLMLEKQKFEPGTVNHMIETTLRTPVLERVQSSVPAKEEAIDIEEEPEAKPVPQRRERAPEEEPVEQRPEPQPEQVRRVRSVKAPPQEPEVPVRTAKPAAEEQPPAVPQRRVRTVATAASGAAGQETETPPTRKLRTVRKVKQ